MPSLTRQIFAALWRISSLLQWLARAASPAGPLHFDGDLLKGLRPKTRRAYAESLAEFEGFLRCRGLSVSFPQEVDAALGLYRQAVRLPRSKFERLVMALLRVKPQFKLQLPRSTLAAGSFPQSYLQGRSRTSPSSWVPKGKGTTATSLAAVV